MSHVVRILGFLLLFVVVSILFRTVAPDPYRTPPDVVPSPVTTQTRPYVSEQIRLAETLSPSAKSLRQTLEYGPVVYRYCPSCFNLAGR